jgi:hypothetical protein
MIFFFQKETSEYLYITRRGTKDEPTVYRFFVILEKEIFFFFKKKFYCEEERKRSGACNTGAPKLRIYASQKAINPNISAMSVALAPADISCGNNIQGKMSRIPPLRLLSIIHSKTSSVIKVAQCYILLLLVVVVVLLLPLFSSSLNSLRRG